jgi:hypothetical protein
MNDTKDGRVGEGEQVSIEGVCDEMSGKDRPAKNLSVSFEA